MLNGELEAKGKDWARTSRRIFWYVKVNLERRREVRALFFSGEYRSRSRLRMLAARPHLLLAFNLSSAPGEPGTGHTGVLQQQEEGLVKRDQGGYPIHNHRYILHLTPYSLQPTAYTRSRYRYRYLPVLSASLLLAKLLHCLEILPPLCKTRT